MRNLTNLHRLKNSDFILGSKMAELNQKKKEKKRKEISKHLQRPDAVRKLSLTWN